MGVLFCIDYHSLRAREYVFLLELVSKYEKAGGKLSFYPNFAFAVALAKYFLLQFHSFSEHDLLQVGM